MRAIELLRQTAALPDKHDARYRREKSTRFHRKQVRPNQEHRAARGVVSRFCPRLACSQQPLEGGLQVLHVRGRLLIQDDEVEGEPLHLHIFKRAQQLTRNVDVHLVRDPQKENWQISGNT